MKQSRTVVLKLPLTANADLGSFVEKCLKTNIELIAVWGERASEIEDEIDWLIIGDGSEDRFIVTTSHAPDEDAIEFAELWNGGSQVSVVTL